MLAELRRDQYMTAREPGRVRPAAHIKARTGIESLQLMALLQFPSRGGAEQAQSMLEAAHKAASKSHSASKPPSKPKGAQVGLPARRPLYNAGGSNRKAISSTGSLAKTMPNSMEPSLALALCSGL